MKTAINRFKSWVTLAFVALITVFFVTCQKDVDPLILKSGISISSFVLNSETQQAIVNADILVDGTIIKQSDAEGKFTLENLKAGEYRVEVSKSGFSNGFYRLTVENCQGNLPVFILKALAPPVVIDEQGGIVPAYYSTGKLAAELVIPANTILSKKRISSTVLFGNEVPKSIASTENIQGTVIQFDSDDPNLALKDAVLTFVLPYSLRPGDLIEVTTFNESTQVWETFNNAVVEADGLTVKVPVDSLSIYSINLDGSYTETAREKLNCEVVASSSNYSNEYEWSSYLNYLSTIPGNDATSVQEIKLYLNQLIEMYSGLSFSKISYTGLPTENFSTTMIANVIAPPLSNPTEYSSLPARPWELIKHSCLVTNKVVLKIFDSKLNAYVDHVVISKYLTSSYDWVWRADDTYSICNYMDCSSGRVVIPVVEQHTGGSTN